FLVALLVATRGLAFARALALRLLAGADAAVALRVAAARVQRHAGWGAAGFVARFPLLVGILRGRRRAARDGEREQDRTHHPARSFHGPGPPRVKPKSSIALRRGGRQSTSAFGRAAGVPRARLRPRPWK